jgi:hypothetical protein
LFFIFSAAPKELEFGRRLISSLRATRKRCTQLLRGTILDPFRARSFAHSATPFHQSSGLLKRANPRRSNTPTPRTSLAWIKGSWKISIFEPTRLESEPVNAGPLLQAPRFSSHILSVFKFYMKVELLEKLAKAHAMPAGRPPKVDCRTLL